MRPKHAAHALIRPSTKADPRSSVDRLQGLRHSTSKCRGTGDVRFSEEDIELANPSRSLIPVVAGFLTWETLALVLGNQPNSTKILQLAKRHSGEPRLIQRDRHIVVVSDEPTV